MTLDEENEFEEVLEDELIEPNVPEVLQEQKVQTYVPKASTTQAGIASFRSKDFFVDPKGEVSLSKDLSIIEQNTNAALTNSQEAINIANRAVTTASNAENVANGIDEKATKALDNSEEATSIANEAMNIANQANQTANEALEEVRDREGTAIYIDNILTERQNITGDIQTQFNNITDKIPDTASQENQLADKNFVNSSINAIAAFYITYNAQGDPFPTKAALDAATTFYSGGQERTPTRNDYCLVLDDEEHNDASVRYVYQGDPGVGQWEFQFVVNETPFTANQLAAINSGITNALVEQISTNQTNLATKADKNNPLQFLTTGAMDVLYTQGYSSGYIHFRRGIMEAYLRFVNDVFNIGNTGTTVNIPGPFSINGGLITYNNNTFNTTSNIAFPVTIENGITPNNFIKVPIITGEAGADTRQLAKAHGIEIGLGGRDYMNFNEYGGVFNFFKTDKAAFIENGGNGDLVAQIAPNQTTFNTGSFVVNGHNLLNRGNVILMFNQQTYAKGNHQLSQGSFNPNEYSLLIWVFYNSGASSIMTMAMPTALFVAGFAADFQMQGNQSNQYMNFRHVNNNTFQIKNNSYMELLQIYGVKY